MNYSKIYNNIITSSILKNRKRNKIDYFENHHITPKSIGGSNDQTNLVLLTAKEHFVCHHLLTKIYPENNKLKFAFWAMCNQLSGDVQRLYKITSTVYETSKLQFAKANSIVHKNKTISQKHRDSASKKWKENNPNKKGSESHMFGKPRHDETKHKISMTKMNHPERNAQYKGDYITPFGIFGSVPQAVRSIPYTYDVINNRCKNPNKIISKTNIKNDANLTINDLGKTWLELGWSFHPAFS